MLSGEDRTDYSGIYQNAVSPAFRRRAYCWITVAGRNVTDILDPYLISVQVIQKIKGGPHTASLELDDREAQLAIPPHLSPVRIELGWAGTGPRVPLSQHLRNVYGYDYDYDVVMQGEPIPDDIKKRELKWEASGMKLVFQGYVDNCESGFSRRGGGRRLWIDCSSSNMAGKLKEPMLQTMGSGAADGPDIPLTGVLSKVLKSAGVFLSAAPGTEKIVNKNWIQDNESPMHFAQRMAAQSGLTFHIEGNRGFLVNRGKTIAGKTMPTVEATWGVNLISWRIKPFSARQQWSGSQTSRFATWEGLHKMTDMAIPGGLPHAYSTAVTKTIGHAPNAQAGEQFNEGMKVDSEKSRGTGWVIINGEPIAQPNGHVTIIGARPGVDGHWLIDQAEHNYTRAGGYTTRLQVIQPILDGTVYQKMGWRKVELNQTNNDTYIAKVRADDVQRQLDAAWLAQIGTAPPGPDFVWANEVKQYEVPPWSEQHEAVPYTTTPNETPGAKQTTTTQRLMGNINILQADGITLIPGIDRNPTILSLRKLAISMGNDDPLAGYGVPPP